MWGGLKDTCEALGLVIGVDVIFNESKLVCTLLKTGSILRLCGADDDREIEKLRGQAFHLVIVDEAASFPHRRIDNLIYRIIGPRLGDHGGTLILLGTPGHTLIGPFWDHTRDGSDTHRPYSERDQYPHWNGWSSHRWTTQDGAPHVAAMARLWANSLVEKDRNRWSDDHPIWLREHLGLWAADDTLSIFKYSVEKNQWDPPRGAHGISGFAILPATYTDWLYVYGFDMGHSDPFAVQIFALSPSDPTRTLYHVYEFERTQMYARTIAQLMLGADDQHPSGCKPLENPEGLLGATGWPAAMVADMTHLGGSILDELSNVYGIRIAKADQHKDHRAATAELFNGDLIDSRIKILKGSKLEHQVQSLQWTTDEWGAMKWPKGLAQDHAIDAAMYARARVTHLFNDELTQSKPITPTSHIFGSPLDENENPFEVSYNDDAPWNL